MASLRDKVKTLIDYLLYDNNCMRRFTSVKETAKKESFQSLKFCFRESYLCSLLFSFEYQSVTLLRLSVIIQSKNSLYDEVRELHVAADSS